ncbi:MAG: hypothetical protein ABR508_10125 [Candidatus Baltobacteraceae bacterium]
MSIFRLTAAGLCLSVLAACAAPVHPQAAGDSAARAEQAAVDNLHLKKRFDGVVSGAEVQRTTLVLYVNQDTLQSMDDAAEEAMIAQTLAQWKSIWRKAHAPAHARVTLSVRNYYGTELTAKSGNV